MGLIEKIAEDLKYIKEKVDKLMVKESLQIAESKFKDKEGLKAKEAAEYLGISRSLLLRHKEQLPHTYLGNRLIFPKSVLREWLEEKSLENIDQKVIERDGYKIKKLN